jgi:hypothetical protein
MATASGDIFLRRYNRLCRKLTRGPAGRALQKCHTGRILTRADCISQVQRCVRAGRVAMGLNVVAGASAGVTGGTSNLRRWSRKIRKLDGANTWKYLD